MSHSPPELVKSVARAAERRQRPDLAARLKAGLERATHPETVVCVVGEFKQGKSSLVNALLAADICPVDDDFATAVPTIISYGANPKVTVHVFADGEVSTNDIASDEIHLWVGEKGNPGNEKGVVRVDIAINHPFLKNGIVLVDTPGVGGLNAAAAQATMAFLPYADAVVFTTDASAELSRAEIEYLRSATKQCPMAVLALTKTDLYQSWRKIAEIDRAHLRSANHETQIIPTSATALAAGLQRSDSNLTRESGVPELREFLLSQVLDSGRIGASRRLVEECGDALEQITSSLRAELSLLNDPESGAAMSAHYKETAERLQQVRDSASRWQRTMNDGITDISSEVSFRFRTSLRNFNERIGLQIEDLRTPEQWDDLAGSLQRDVVQLTADLFAEVDERVDALARQVAEILRDDLELNIASTVESGVQLVGGSLEAPKDVSGLSRVGSNTMGAMRGAQSGILLFGMLGRLLPLGAGAILFSNPVTLLLGAAFAGKQVRAVRKQNLMARRQQARSSVRAFVESYQMEIANHLSTVLREHSRILRDHFTARVGELQTAAHALAEQAQKDLSVHEDERLKRASVLNREAQKLAELRDAVAKLEDGLSDQVREQASNSPQRIRAEREDD